MSQLSIRPAALHDCSLILHFIRRLAQYERLEHEVRATVEDLEGTLFGPKPAAEVLLAYEGDQPVGFALFFQTYSTFLAKSGLYLEDLYVEEAFRGKGYGKALLLKIAEIGVERGCGRYEWSVLDWNTPSIEFYRSLGAVAHPEWIRFRVSPERCGK